MTEIEDNFTQLVNESQFHCTHHDVSLHRFQNEVELVYLRKSILEWFDLNQRPMPWRKPERLLDIEDLTSPQLGQRAYEVWVSEIMLQQTQVSTVIPYFNKWMEVFPDITTLSKASLEDVHTIWAGLGYYSRAKRLHEGAKLVVGKYNGILPYSVEVLKKEIPGVGPYTAGAISSIAYGQPTGLVDGNVIRVLSRLRAIGGDPKSQKMTQLLWDLADQVVDPLRPGDFNQAIMELGATVCTVSDPNCNQCPLYKVCRTFAERLSPDIKLPSIENSGSIKEACKLCLLEIEKDPILRYPRKVKKKAPRKEECITCIIERKSTDLVRNMKVTEILIAKRNDKGLLAGLWEFPCLEQEETVGFTKRKSLIKMFIESMIGPVKVQRRTELGNYIHKFSHIHKNYIAELWEVQSKVDDLSSLADSTYTDKKWVQKNDIGSVPLPTALKKAVKLYQQRKGTLDYFLIKKEK